jgi:hypothetical protein
MAESLRNLLIVLAFITLGVAVALEFIGHPATDAWAAFGAALTLLAGQHLEKPTRSLRHGWTD